MKTRWMKIQRVFLLCILKIQHNEPDNYLRFHVTQSILKFHLFHKNYFPIKEGAKTKEYRKQ